MMINPVSTSSVAQAYSAPAAAPAKPAASSAPPPQDSVHLSSQATGDVDHDGDSH